MKKLTKKQIVTIAVSAVIVIALIIVGIVLGAKSNNTENKKVTDKKVESVEKEDEKEMEKEDSETEKAEEDTEEPVNEEVQNDDTSSNQTTDNTGSTTKNETSANKNNTTNKVTSSNKPSQTVTETTLSHVHTWTEVKTQVTVPETGHYEKVSGWVWFCTVCGVNADSWTNEEKDAHTFGDECPGKIDLDYKNIGEKWVVDTPATTEERVTGYKCSCGATREKTQYAGMYSNYDKASWERLEACHQFFKQGLAGDATKKTETFLSYGNWDSVVVSNGSTNGAWMWIFIRDWKLDNYDYLKDSVTDGTNTQEEADMVKALYEEIPSIFKGAIEIVAPEGGTELYNYVEKLIVQTGGDPDDVPDLPGAQGLIPENIPGLYVTIEEIKGGFGLMFWAE